MNSFSEEHVFTNSFSTATCYDWSYLVDTDNCVEDNLVMNEWLTADFMSLLEPSDAKLELVSQLYNLLNKTIHSIPDLSMRNIRSPTEGLCGIAALYKALYDTILTKSALKLIGYYDMRNKIAREIANMETGNITNLFHLGDSDLLQKYHNGQSILHYYLQYLFH